MSSVEDYVEKYINLCKAFGYFVIKDCDSNYILSRNDDEFQNHKNDLRNFAKELEKFYEQMRDV